MNAEDRIAALETKLAELQQALFQTNLLTQHLGGQARMFHSAVLAVIASHPQPQDLKAALLEHLARTDASIVSEALSEEHVDGAQATKHVIELALDAALKARGGQDVGG